MKSCDIETWKIQDLASAIQNEYAENKQIAVPMFQRGKRWDSSQEKLFIDSLRKGFPVGSMLFYKLIEQDTEKYILVDGLQRGNSIKKFINNSADFIDYEDIPDKFCENVLQFVNGDDAENYDWLRSILIAFIKEHTGENNIPFYLLSREIIKHFQAPLDEDSFDDLTKEITDFFDSWDETYKQIAEAEIPVIIYQGDVGNLPDIFEKINSQGTPLNQYEVYAAAWPTKKRFAVSSAKITSYVMKKYDSFEEDGFTIHGYNPDEMRRSKEVNAFEYLFGLSKLLAKEYGDILRTEQNIPDDTVNPLGFELVNACLNDSDEIKTLYTKIYDIDDKDAFDRALHKAIEFVQETIDPVFKFKGNLRSTGFKITHSKHQIYSMVSTTFREMYTQGDFTSFSEQWNTKKDMLKKNLLHYYVYDIITNYWSEGVGKKMYNAVKTNRYESELSLAEWRTALDGFYEKSMIRLEPKKVANPGNEEYVILNCTYLKIFSSLDQLSSNIKFDVEHIATKDQMKRLNAETEGPGLPISCIANLCYLPEAANRSKKDKNFYQDTHYLQYIDLDEVEKKYSFTTKKDLEWMDVEYKGADDFETLKRNYFKFCNKRFEKIKRAFCDSLDLDYDAMQDMV